MSAKFRARIGCGQLTWKNRTEDEVLAEIKQAGYDGAPAVYIPARTAGYVLERFRRHGLLPAPGYLGAMFWRKELQEEILLQAARTTRFLHGVGCTELYVAAGGGREPMASGRTRREAAGHVRAEDGLSDSEYRQFADMLNRVGEIALTEGVTICFHNHAGTVIETREEIDRLMSLVDRRLVYLGPDTGHLAWAGADPVQFCRDYAGSIKSMHLKDINASVRAEGVRQGWTYEGFVQAGIFTELGTGSVDFPAIIDLLRQQDFDGWLIVETDVTQQPTALQSAQMSRDYLRTLGL
jgi:inosose dehydratase